MPVLSARRRELADHAGSGRQSRPSPAAGSGPYFSAPSASLSRAAHLSGRGTYVRRDTAGGGPHRAGPLGPPGTSLRGRSAHRSGERWCPGAFDGQASEPGWAREGGGGVTRGGGAASGGGRSRKRKKRSERGVGPSSSCSLGDVGGAGALVLFVSAYSLSFSSSAHFGPRPRPLTPDPPLLHRRAVTADPDLDPAVLKAGPKRPLRLLKGSVWALRLPAEWGRERPFRPLPSPDFALGPQTTPLLAAWSLILAQSGPPSAPGSAPGSPLSATGPPACFVVVIEPFQPGGWARPS
ncbi:hypothetical protein P7K49_017258 [Saguinus oedipus]|uniref:Uncharacterized protein n=1 Tax=Saguinus oedipus TaxID=9490 RepID=A0ABQ9V4P3_SAGOE|nr:hypothetical protein P7K49_017258 [Saguinus oedipus]